MMKNYNSLGYRQGSMLNQKEPDVVGNAPNNLGKARTSWLMSLAFLLFFMIGNIGNAQTNIANYAFTTTTGATYTPISGGTVFATTGYDNAVSAAITMGGTFPFGGVNFTTCYISTNGFITFGAAPSSSSYTPLSTLGTTTGAIAAYAQDAGTSSTASPNAEIRYLNTGTEFVVQFKDHSNFYNSATDKMNFQIRLTYATGAINIVYGSCVNTGTSTSGGTAQVGIRGNSVTYATNVNNLYATNVPAGTTCSWANAVTGYANTSSLVLTAGTNANINIPNGLTYTWTPATQLPVRTFAAAASITSSGATLSWTAPTGATSYNVQYRIPGTCSWTNWSGNPVATNSVTLTGLSSNTVYQVRVQAKNSTSQSIYSHIPNSAGTGDGYATTGTFTTLPPACSGTPTAGTVAPTNQNICTGSTPANLVVSGYSTGVTGITFQWMQSTDNSSFVNVTGGSGATTATYTPAAFAGTKLYYKCRVTCSTSSLSADTASVTVDVPAAPTTQATATTLTNVNYNSLTASWTIGNGARRVVYISNAPIVDPVNTTATAAPTANTVYAGSGQQVILDGTVATVNVTGLTAGTTYYVKVYEYTRCGAGPYDSYYNVTSVTNGASTTTLSPISTFPFTETYDTTSTTAGQWFVSAGTGASYQWAFTTADATYGAAGPAASTRFAFLNVFNASTTYNTYNFISPKFTLDAAPKYLDYNFFLGSGGNQTSSPAPLAIQVSVDGGAYSTIYTHSTANSTFATTNAISNWQLNTIDLTTYAGHSVQFKFIANSNWGSGICNQGIDEFKIYNIPTCFKPTALTSSAITSSGATISWTAPTAGTPASYQYEVRSSGVAGSGATGLAASGTTTAPTATAAVTGLTANTSYSVYVRTFCGGTDYSSWTAASTFTTLCSPSSLPWTEGFEGIATVGTNIYPSCWNYTNITLNNSSSTSMPHTGTKNLTGSWSFDVWYYTPSFNLTAGTSYTFSYWMKEADTTAGYVVTTTVGSSASVAGQTTTLDTNTVAGSTTWVQKSFVYIPTTSGVYNFGIHNSCPTSAPNGIYFDDFGLNVTPTTITSFTPTTVCAQGASTVTITGAVFTGATGVSFNGTAATSYTVVDDTHITAVAPLGVTTGSITVNGVNNTATSATSLTVTPNPTVAAITFATSASPYCMGSTTALQVADTTPGGTWASSNTSILTIDGNGIITPVATGTASVTYTITNLGCTTVVNKNITTVAPPTVVSSTVSQTVVTGTTATYTVVANGTGLTYQWQESTDNGLTFTNLADNTTYSGTTTATLTITNTPGTNNGYYYHCTVSGASPCAVAVSNDAILNVGDTGIATHPSPVNLCDSGSGSAVFTVVPSGTVNSYQWQEDTGFGPSDITDGTVGGVTYSGATTATLTITGLTTAQSGFNYIAVVTGPANTATSNPALLTINQGVSVTTAPTNQTVCYTGGSATFTTAATGSVSGYQWQYSTDNSTWNSVANGTPAGATYAGATTASLSVTTTALTPASGTYSYRANVLASTPCANVASASAQLLINNPTITTQPVASSVLGGNSTTFTAATSAVGATYQWQYATTATGTYANVANGVPANVTYSGDTTGTLTVTTTSSAAASTANFYRLVATSNSCSVNSNGAQMTVTNYCTIPAATSTSSYFNGFSTTGGVTNITNNSSGFSTGGYGNFLAQSASQLQGSSVNFSTSLTGTTVGVAIWVDWNQNAIFETSERVYNTTGYVSTASGSFLVPATALPGNTRMRIFMDYNASNPANPCGPFASGRGEAEDYTFTVLVPPPCSGTPTAGTATSSVANVCFTGSANLTATGYSTGVTGISMQWYNSAGAISGATSATYTTPVLTASETYYMRVTCANGGAYADTNSVTIGVDAPAVTATTPGTRCGTGTVALSATPSTGAALTWYAAATGGSPLATGNSFTTPSITATTNYYVEANVGGSAGNVGANSPSVGTYSTSFTGSYEIFNVTSPLALNTVDVYPTAAGTVIVQLMDSTGAVLQTSSTYTVTAAQANTTLSVVGTPVTIPVGFNIPVGTGYRLNFGSSSTATLVRNSAGATATYGPSLGLTITGNSNATTGYYYNFYNWSVSTGCHSARTAVTATVTAPPALTLNGASTSICSGSSSSAVTVTSTVSNFDTYTWSPSTGVSGSAAAGFTFNPTATTAYTLTASNAAGCVNTTTYNVTVNPLPGNVVISPASTTMCSIDAPVLLSAAIGSNTVVLSENFDTSAPTWTITNGSSSPAASNFVYPSAPYTDTSGSATFSSFTTVQGGKFALANADAGGSGTTTNTVLTSPSFSTVGLPNATLTFEHAYEYWSSGDTSVKLEISTNGGTTWSLLVDYKGTNLGVVTNGSQTTVPASVSLNAYLNQANVKIRYNYVSTWGYYWIIDNVKVASIPGTEPITWTPTAGLFTDAAGTVPYTGTARTTVYAKPTTATATYTATATTTNGCIKTGTATVNVTTATTWYADADADGYGNVAVTQLACSQPTGYVANSTDCDDTNAAIYRSALLYTDADGDGYNAGSATVCYGATLPTGTSLTTLGSDCNDSNAAMHASYNFYVDADGDTYGTGTAVSVCAVNATTPPTGYSVNNTDCDDTNAAIYRSALLYTDADADGYNAGSAVTCYGATLPTGTSLTTLGSDCNDSNAAMHASYNFYVDADGDGFGSVTATATPMCAVNATTPPVTGYSPYNTDCDDTNAAVHPGAIDVCYDGLDNNCDGIIDNGCTPIVTQVQISQCGITLATVSDYIYADVVAYAQGYRFKVTDMTTNQVQSIDKALRVFTLTQLPVYNYGRTYKIEVSVKINNAWQPQYGRPCNVSTPITPAPSATTKIQSSQCGTTLTTMGDIIYADNIVLATGYRFEVTNMVTNEIQIVDRPLREFRMNILPIQSTITFATMYSVRVAFKDAFGNYLPYGSACTITTPLFPKTAIQSSQCGSTIASNSTGIYADIVANATMYRFKLENSALAYSATVDKTLRVFTLTNFTGLQVNTTYNVSVSVQINGVFGPYGNVCSITTPSTAFAPAPTTPSTAKTAPELVTFNAIAYPNPYSENFKLNIATPSQENIQILVYDMLGKRVEDREVKVSDIATFEVGSNYPSGVYNVIVNQGDNTQTLRVIKR